MNRLFPLPVYTFIKIAFQNGGFSAKGLLNVSPWIMKTLLFEPLRWYELATKNKRIKDYKVARPPIFILGYYRSGTTYLQQLFMEDDRLGYLSNFQMVFPEIMLSCEKWLTPPLEFISRTFKIRNHIHRIPLTWYKSPGEEDVAMTTFMNQRAAQWGYFFPERVNDYFEKYVLFENIDPAEIEQWKQDYLLLVKKISLANKGRQLVLKSPPNTARIKHLLTLFPDAKFIHIARNPYDVYASNKRLWKVVNEYYSLGKMTSTASSVIINSYSKSMRQFFDEKHLIMAGRMFEIQYEDFINNPVDNMRRIYDYLQLGDFQYCEQKITEYTARQKDYAVLNHQLTEEEIKLVSENWDLVIRKLGYKVF